MAAHLWWGFPSFRFVQCLLSSTLQFSYVRTYVGLENQSAPLIHGVCGTYKGDATVNLITQRGLRGLVLVIGLGLGLGLGSILYCRIWHSLAPPYVCPEPGTFCSLLDNDTCAV